MRSGRIVVRDNSPQLELLRSMQNSEPGLSWTALPERETAPLELVNSGQADYAIVDANEFEFAQYLYPEVSVAWMLPNPRPLVWIVRAGESDLAAAANRFFAAARASGEFALIQRAARSESHEFNYEDAHRFQADIATLLPELQSLFEQGALQTGI